MGRNPECSIAEKSRRRPVYGFALGFGQHERLMISAISCLSQVTITPRRRCRVSGGASLRIAISLFPCASYRKILQIGTFCFGVAGELKAKFGGPLIIVGKCRRKQAKESNCPKTRNEPIVQNIRQKTSRRVSLRPIIRSLSDRCSK
jgi:hypothetical protein